MNRGLWMLLWFRFIALGRAVRRELFGKPGNLLAGSLGVMVLAVLARGAGEVSGSFPPDLTVLLLLPGVLLMALLVFSGSKAPMAGFFTWPEIGLLFSAPIGRRELLLWKLAEVLVWAAGISVLAAWFFQSAFGGWAMAFGVFLCLSLIGLGLGFLYGHAVTAVEQRVSARLAKVVSWLVAGVFLFWVAEWIRVFLRQDWEFLFTLHTMAPLMEELRETSFFRIAFFPFAPVRLMVEGSAYWGWGASFLAGLAVAALLLALGFLINADYYRGCFPAGEKRARFHEKGVPGGGPGHRRVWISRLGWPRLPRWGGVGPVASIQAVLFLRQGIRGKLFILAVAFGLMGAVIWFDPEMTGGEPGMKWILGGLLIWLVFLMGVQAWNPNDQAGCQTWPMTPLAMATGMILPVALADWVMQMAGLMVIGWFLGESWVLLAMGLFFLPLNVLSGCCAASVRLTWPESFPKGGKPSGTGLLLHVLFFFLVWGSALAMAFAAALCLFLLGYGTVAAWAGAWVVLAFITAGFLRLTASCFRRWQPARMEGHLF